MRRKQIASALLFQLCFASSACGGSESSPWFSPGCPPGEDAGDDEIDPGACFWKYSPSLSWKEAHCIPVLENGRSVEEIRVRIDPADVPIVPATLPQLLLLRFDAFGPTTKTIAQKSDPSISAEGWSSSHWIAIRPQAPIDLGSFNYQLVFAGGDADGIGPILETVIEYDPD